MGGVIYFHSIPSFTPHTSPFPTYPITTTSYFLPLTSTTSLLLTFPTSPSFTYSTPPPFTYSTLFHLPYFPSLNRPTFQSLSLYLRPLPLLFSSLLILSLTLLFLHPHLTYPPLTSTTSPAFTYSNPFPLLPPHFHLIPYPSLPLPNFSYFPPSHFPYFSVLHLTYSSTLH